MHAHDHTNFLAAMITELRAHIDRGHWKLLKRSKKPPDVKTIQMVWSFKRKRRPDGSLLKHKARVCVNGAMQKHNVNYWQTYSPVVRWSTIRLMLALSLTEKLIARQVDFVLAYPHADVETEIYLELPAGYEQFLPPNANPRDYVLLLIKNVYGLKQAGRTWFQFLQQHLIQRGYTPSEHDPCLFSNGTTVLIVYVNGILLFGKDKADMQA